MRDVALGADLVDEPGDEAGDLDAGRAHLLLLEARLGGQTVRLRVRHAAAPVRYRIRTGELATGKAPTALDE